MQIYLLTKKIIMQTTEFNNLILRIGRFHLSKNWLALLGQHLRGCDLLKESGLYGQNAVRAILHGLQYNCGVQNHEAICRIQLESFLAQHEDSPSYILDYEYIPLVAKKFLKLSW